MKGEMSMTKRFLAAVMSFVLGISGINFTPPAKAAETETKEETKVNLALNKQVYFSSEEGTSTSGVDTHAVKAVDGDTSTCWSASGSAQQTPRYPEWICVDLGKSYTIQEVDLLLETKGDRYYGYNIYVSDTAPENEQQEIPSSFKQVITKENNESPTKEPAIEKVNNERGRYVLVQITNCSAYTGGNKYAVASIYELAVYGIDAGSVEPPDDEDDKPFSVPIQTASGRDEAYVKEIDGEWLFGGKGLSDADALKADYMSWQKVTIPHTWNDKDGEDGGGNYERTKYWYHKEIDITEEMLKKHIYIEFLGSNTQTTLYVNGEKAGDTHQGGYTAFRYDITDKVKMGKNQLDVSVDNTYTQTIAPISGDFNMYGGIYRRVYLITVDDVHVDLNEYGSSGLALKTGNMRSQTAPADLGEFDICANFVNDSDSDKIVTVVATVTGDNAPTPITKQVTIPKNGKVSFTEHCKVENPTLWEGIRYEKGADNTKVGYQYKVTLEVKDGDTVIDKVEDKLGFRYFWIDSKENGESGEGFFLNGKKFPLRGVNRHSCLKEVGSAMTEKQHAEDMEIIKELGVNTIRLCHYPHTDYFYDLCDENGIIVWTEIPVVNEVRATEEFKKITKQQLRELITQQFNRPSVCFWGLENEIGNGRSLDNALDNQDLASAKRTMFELDELAKELDKTGRYTTQAVNRDYSMNQNDPESVNKDFESNVGWKSDIVAWNIYPGWYPDANFYGTFDEVMKRKTALDSRSMGISEYGWGGNVNQHEANPKLGMNDLSAGGPWHPEEYQNLMNEEAIQYLNTHDELWGTYYWVMFDFAVDSRNEGSQPALNDKGLVTADRKIKKDSYYLYKANWNKKDLFTYITSRRWTKRETATTDIKVYSNCDKVTLYINNENVGDMESKGNGVFLLKDVPLTVGNVEIKAVGSDEGSTETYEDICTWTREISTKADLESEDFAIDTKEKTIVVENNTTLQIFKEKVKGVNNAVYTIYNADGETEITTEDTKIVPGMKIKVVAEDGVTTATYTVVNSNLCLNKKVTVSSFQEGNIAENAVDGNTETKWTAVNGTYPQAITIDLGKAYNLDKLMLDWDKKNGNRQYQYAISISEDGTTYIDVVDARNNTRVGRTTDSLYLTKARYIRITAVGCNEAGWATLFEVKADGYSITSEKYTIDEEHRLIIVDEIPTSGLADATFKENLVIEGNYDSRMNYSSGWIHDGNTVDILDKDGNIVVTYTICTEETKEKYSSNVVEVEKVVLNEGSKSISVGADLKLLATILPTNATDKKLIWTSSDEEVASVDDKGVVTGKKAGEAIITVTVGKCSAECKIIVNDFDNLEPVVYLPFDQKDEITIYGKAEIVKDPDNDSNQALLVDSTGGGKNGNYAIANKELKDIDFSKGVTISLKVRPTANVIDWNYLFAIGQTKTHGTFNYCDGTIGFIARHGEPYEAHFPGDGWIEGNPVNSEYDFFTKEENANKWHRFTYVYDKSEVWLYMDDIPTCHWAAANISSVLANLNQGHLIIGAGSSEGELENFGGYIDDFYVYNAALDAKAVAAIGKPSVKPEKPGEEQKPPVTPEKPGEEQKPPVTPEKPDDQNKPTTPTNPTNPTPQNPTTSTTPTVNTSKDEEKSEESKDSDNEKTPTVPENPDDQKTPTVSENPSDQKTPNEEDKKDTNNKDKKKTKVTVGKKVTVGNGKSKAVYKVAKKRTAIYTKSKAKKNTTRITIPVSIKIQGKKYKIVGIAKSAFVEYKKLKVVVIEAKNLTKKDIKGCFEGSSVEVVKVPKEVYKKYKKIFTKKITKSNKKIVVEKL